MNRISCGNDADTLRPEAHSLHSLTWSLYRSPLSSVAWGTYDLGFYQLCPCVHSSWEAVTKTNERSRREEVSRFMLLLEHSLTGGEGRSSQWPLSHAISRPSLITSPSPSSSGIFPSLQPFPYFLSLPFLPLPYFPFPFFHATPGWLQILPQAWSINLDPALTTLYFWNHPFKSVICFSPRPQLKRQESHVAFVCPTWPSQQAQGTKLISHIK